MLATMPLRSEAQRVFMLKSAQSRFKKGFPGGYPLRTRGIATVQPSKRLPFSYERLGLVAFVLDVALVFMLGILSGVVYHAIAFGQISNERSFFGAGLTCAVLFTLGMQSQHLYRSSVIVYPRNIIRSVLITWTGIFCLLLVVAFLAKISWEFSRGATICFFISGAIALPLARVAAQQVAHYLIRNNHLSGRRSVVLIGDRSHILSGDLSADLTRHGFKVVNQFVVAMTDDNRIKNLGEISASIETLKQCLRDTRVDEIFLAFDTGARRTIEVISSELQTFPVPVRLLLDGYFNSLFSRTISDFGAARAIKLQSGPLTEFQQLLKRSFDVALALVGLVVLAPVFLLVGLAIKLDTPGPTLFRQRRAGFGGRTFTIYKFRSMTTMDDGAVVKQATRNDKRVTRVGWWLRKTSIDELPQLLNVLRGDMSLVGPRPHALSHDNEYDKLIATYALRQHMKPGITGWAQVNGCRGETSSLSLMEARVRHDIWYIGHWSLRLDVATIAMTMVQVIRPRNVY